EACVRLPSPVLHTATALAVYWLGSRLYDSRIGALSGLAFATLPGVSLSAGIISTDVPLLLCWALALVGFSALLESDDLWPAL
ncbi:ArnT family glycosyltransferase, partial [Vibrio cholerae]|uniref:ArnT family glycosyltransferase n=1 Tax=Vibrio cholerae TaxID=666 RepID=UPI0018F09384